MASTLSFHRKLTNGEGKCSVPMCRGGVPSGFCDDASYGEPTKEGKFRYTRYVPALACYKHGGPEEKINT